MQNGLADKVYIIHAQTSLVWSQSTSTALKSSTSRSSKLLTSLAWYQDGYSLLIVSTTVSVRVGDLPAWTDGRTGPARRRSSLFHGLWAFSTLSFFFYTWWLWRRAPSVVMRWKMCLQGHTQHTEHPVSSPSIFQWVLSCLVLPPPPPFPLFVYTVVMRPSIHSMAAVVALWLTELRGTFLSM